MSKTKIEWSEQVWNPITGCTKVSAGCKNCYAETIANRFWKDRKFTDVQCHEDRLSEPLKRKKPTMYFVNSMSDLFHEDVPFEFIDRMFRIMHTTPHIFQILTKRPERMLEYYELGLAKAGLAIGDVIAKPNSNIWLGVSVENNLALKRAEILQAIPAAVRFISFEPLLEEVPILYEANVRGIDLDKIHWAIIGCESGHKKRECKTEWIEGLVADLKGWEIPTFVKQININGKVEKDIEKFPKRLQIREFPNEV